MHLCCLVNPPIVNIILKTSCYISGFWEVLYFYSPDMECIRLWVSFTYLLNECPLPFRHYSMCIFILMFFTALIRHVEIILERAITCNVSRPVVKLKNSGELSGLDMV